jgi:hypothetical protein
VKWKTTRTYENAVVVSLEGLEIDENIEVRVIAISFEQGFVWSFAFEGEELHFAVH